jgi:hypothetical protein
MMEDDMKRRIATLQKPTITAGQVLGFAEGRRKEEKATAAPAGDVRLTINLREDLHMKLKLRAVKDKTTAGELIESLVEQYL